MKVALNAGSVRLTEDERRAAARRLGLDDASDAVLAQLAADQVAAYLGQVVAQGEKALAFDALKAEGLILVGRGTGEVW